MSAEANRCQPLTVKSVAVSVFARHCDDDGVEPFLRPPLQTVQSSVVHFLRSLKLVHAVPHVTGPGEEEHREFNKCK